MSADKALHPGHRMLPLVTGITLLTLTLATPGLAAIITVTSTGDSIVVDGFVTLREALCAANINATCGDAPAGDSGLDQIRFNIAGAPGTVHTIQPGSALPIVTDPVFIDGYSQLGATPNTLPDGDNAFLAIQLDGLNAGFQPGLTVAAGGSTVQGLVINRFNNEGILIVGASGNVIRGNFLGTDQTGQIDRGNGTAGVALFSSNNTVGGIAPAYRNLISGNDFAGVTLTNVGVSGNHLEGNFIGSDRTGANPIPNGAGVRISSAADNTIGGAAAGAKNLIAFNTGVGVLISANAALGNAVVGNSIHDNGGLGIDLNNDGVTPNDPPANLDGDTGPNGLQNFPVLTSAVTNGLNTFIVGRLDSAASTQYRIEFFVSSSCDPSGSGEGATSLGSQNVTTSGSGSADVFFTSAIAVAVGQAVIATATGPDGTSEFSACATVIGRPPRLGPTPRPRPTRLPRP